MTSPGPRTPPYSALVSAVRSEGEALVSAARSGADAQVETCGDWTVADLARHVWQVYARRKYEEPLHEIGNVMADDVELAKVYARSIYDEFSWIEMVLIPRETIVTVIES